MKEPTCFSVTLVNKETFDLIGMFQGMEMVFRIAVAILQTCQEDLLALDMEGLLKVCMIIVIISIIIMNTYGLLQRLTHTGPVCLQVL